MAVCPVRATLIEAVTVQGVWDCTVNDTVLLDSPVASSTAQYAYIPSWDVELEVQLLEKEPEESAVLVTVAVSVPSGWRKCSVTELFGVNPEPCSEKVVPRCPVVGATLTVG